MFGIAHGGDAAGGEVEELIGFVIGGEETGGVCLRNTGFSLTRELLLPFEEGKVLEVTGMVVLDMGTGFGTELGLSA